MLSMDMNQGVHFQSSCFFSEFRTMVVGPGVKYPSHTVESQKEVELLTREKKTVERKLEADLYTLKILQNTVLFLHEI